MKVLGISFGRVNGRSDVLVKEALFAAKAAGAEVQFINTFNLEITHCRACGYCNKCRDSAIEIHCCLKDDFHILEDAYMEADGVIMAAPVYAVGTVGQFKNFVDRFGPHRDRTEMIEENKRRVASGRELLDPKLLKDRYVGYISVGGAKTHNWVALGLPMMELFTFSTCAKSIGHIDAYDQGRTGHPILDKNLMNQCAELGRAIAEAVGKPYEQVDTWIGNKGVCPVCHNTLVDFMEGVKVECPVCGIRGYAFIENGELSFSWSEDEIGRARSTVKGLYEHFHEIKNMHVVSGPKMEAAKEEIEKAMLRYKNFEEEIAKM